MIKIVNIFCIYLLWDNQVIRRIGQDSFENGGLYVMCRQHVNLPEGAYKAAAHWEHGDIVWFTEGPVVGGEGPGQRALPQGDDEVHTPEKSHGVVDLQIEEVPLQETLVVVLDEDAAGWGAAWVIWRGEVLRAGDGKVNNSELLSEGDWTHTHPHSYKSVFYKRKNRHIITLSDVLWSHLRVTVLCAIHTLTVTHRGVESHHSVDGTSWSGQISTYIGLREELILLIIEAIERCFINTNMYTNIHTHTHTHERIQSSGAPVSNTHHQEDKGDQRVQQSGHHVTDRPGKHEHTQHDLIHHLQDKIQINLSVIMTNNK